ncbi:adhesion G-protein coupled receptor D1-like [Haliotis rubra]|uniref:adhesion G-protein coupled receptor D1-like n=1 Tax=Haliotis rubra TaxID=36100 RepID=UPI001EE5427A|nr:adhesion G-protein coupled receptor D1-like [Haliotis rubra]
MVVRNIPLVAEQYNMTYYMFSVYELVYINIDNSSKLVNVPSFGLTLTFRTNQTCCRDAFEETMVALLGDVWSMEFNGSVFQFRLSQDDFNTYGVSKRQLYKMHPPFTSPQKTETYDSFPSEFVETPKDFVYFPTVLPKCSYVQFSTNEFNWNTDSSISLRYVDITIDHDKLIKIDDQDIIICVDTIEEVYSNYQDPVKLAKTILTIVFSILSLICLALTFITYCTFPSLLTLPTKNTMCLVGFLFLAQLLLLLKDVPLRNETACKIFGVLLHYLWLTVILWMNVCSYHMFHVFVVDAAKPIGTQSHRSRLVKYSLYANGLSLLIVLITIFSNLGMSSGSHIGYGVNTCYLSTSLLVGVAFVAPLSIVLVMNIIFFSVSVWTMAKINKMSASIGSDKSQVHIYIKLSTLTGIFWILAILGEVLQQQVLIFISIVLNAGQGIFIFISYAANKRVLQLWRGKN